MKWLLLSLYTLSLAIYHVHACPTYWTYNGGSCYRYIGLPQTYARAESVCKMFTGCASANVGAGAGLGHLVSINSIEENQFVFSMLASNFGEIPPPPAWLGLSDNNQNQNFVWSDGTPLGQFTAWAPNSPNQNNNVNCAIYAELIRPRWMDVMCEEEFPYICEVPASTMEKCPGASDPTNPAPPPLQEAPNRPKVVRYSASSNAQHP